MLALSSLALAATLLPTPAARAGSWTYAVTGDYSASTVTDNGVKINLATRFPYSPGSGSYTIDIPNGSSGSGCAIHAVVKFTATFTWQPAAGQTMTSDPPPDKVVVLESETTFWKASLDSMHGGSVSGHVVSDLGDKEYDPPNPPPTNPPTIPPIIYQNPPYTGVGYSGSQPDQSYPPPVPTPVLHFTSRAVSNGVVTLPQRTVTADANATINNWYYSAKASVGYGASIHAQPYNWHIKSVTDNGDGTLTFYYDWLSTSGSKADLTSCYMHEYVTYPGPVGTAMFPLQYTMPPPFYGTLRNPTVRPGTGSSGQQMTTLQAVDDQNMPTLSLISPHVPGSFTGTQEYQYDDTATGVNNTIIPGPDSGPLPIVRSVYSQGGILWYYSVTKSGYTATKPI